MNDIPASESFLSILWPAAAQADTVRDDVAQPECFHDLNLDQIVAAIAAAWPDENLQPFFHVSLHDVDAVGYRQAVLRDLERDDLRQAIQSFVQGMRDMRAQLAGIKKLAYPREKKRAFLGAAKSWCNAVQALAQALQDLRPASAGLLGLQGHLAEYTASAGFRKLVADSNQLLRLLDEIRYGLLVRGDSVTVRAYEEEADASVEVEATFAKFRRAGLDGRPDAPRGGLGVMGLNHVEAQVLDRVALLFPKTFAALNSFCDTHADFIEPVIARCAREVCFYLAWLQHIQPLKHAGLVFCYPVVSAASKAIACADSFDVALGVALVQNQESVVRNGFTLDGPERIVVVSGPNHGGKTTFARMFGQLHWLAALGLTIPGTSARLFLFDRLFTHFEREEDITTLRGKLKDDLVRIQRILAEATPDSLIVLNEIFASTTLEDAVSLGRKIMARISRLDALALCVTFLVELADCGEKTVSMVAAINPHDPAIRTFKVERRPADGLAYALAVANKYRVTREALLQRIAPCKPC